MKNSHLKTRCGNKVRTDKRKTPLFTKDRNQKEEKFSFSFLRLNAEFTNPGIRTYITLVLIFAFMYLMASGFPRLLLPKVNELIKTMKSSETTDTPTKSGTETHTFPYVKDGDD
jgi:hypothetical protein